MNTSTYAKLIKPPQFKPNESVTFRLEFSRDLSCSNATLRIYGYTLDVDKGGSYSGLTMTKYIGTFIAGVGVEEFVIPPNTLGEIPPDDSIMYWSSGTMKAVVEIGDFKSNEIIVDMIMDLPSDTYIEPDNGTLISTGSTYKLNIVHNPRATFGSYDSNEVNSYRVLLYDQDYNLINVFLRKIFRNLRINSQYSLIKPFAFVFDLILLFFQIQLLQSEPQKAL